MRDIPKTADGAIDWPRFVFEDPERALAIRDEQVKRDMRNEYLNAKNKEDWEKQFYRKYPNLDTTLGRTVVWDTLKGEFPKISDMPISESNGIVADQAEKTMARLKREEKVKEQYAAYSGGPAENVYDSHNLPPAPEDSSLGSIIKGRAAARREAAQTVRYGNYDD